MKVPEIILILCLILMFGIWGKRQMHISDFPVKTCAIKNDVEDWEKDKIIEETWLVLKSGRSHYLIRRAMSMDGNVFQDTFEDKTIDKKEFNQGYTKIECPYYLKDYP